MLVRLIVWTFGVALSFLPLFFVAATLIAPNTDLSFLQALSNEELLAVAFTLGGVAAVDVLITARAEARTGTQPDTSGGLQPLRVGIGLITLFLTFTSMGIYLLLKFKVAHWTPEATVFTVQSLCAGTVVTSFLCETRS